MKLKHALIRLKSLLQGGEHSVQTFRGLLPEEKRNQFINGSSEVRSGFIQKWRSSGKLVVENETTINWKEVLIKLRNHPKHLKRIDNV